MLNLGCGERFHPDWVNLDMNAANPEVLIADLRRGIPFPSAQFAVVYHSHVLEHLPREMAGAMIDECYRVLAPAGCLRVVVPDLESLVKEYLSILKMIDEGDERGHKRYEWILLELFDQFVRKRPGGEMLDYLRRGENPEVDYIVGRIGMWAEPFLRGGTASTTRSAPIDFKIRLRYLLRRIRNGLSRWWGGRNFGTSGEVHQWMYDRYSLARLVESSGFNEVQVVSHDQSRIPGWSRYQLDTDDDGRAAIPGSLYLEAIKP